MTKRLTKDELEGFEEDFDVTQAEIKKVYAWMQENVGEYDNLTNLAEAAMIEFSTIEDEDLFFELAFKFESVVG